MTLLRFATPPDLTEALRRASSISPDASDLFRHPAFIALRETCDRLYPEPQKFGHQDFALSHALDRLDVRGQHGSLDEASARAVAFRLHEAFTATTARRVHLVPLDIADNFPPVHFGPNESRKFTADELSELLAPLGPKGQRFDAKRFSEFPWLVVHEQIDFTETPRQRGSPWWNMRLDRDFAAIDPHKKRFPPVVENALFCMLLAPWEEWNAHSDINWRSFEAPWVLTIDHDLFTMPPRIPSPDTLSWEPDIFLNEDGETIELEKPATYQTHDQMTDVVAWLTDERWELVSAALRSPLFETPISHFLLSAFMGDGIDEFMGHLTALEASLGRFEDNGREKVMKARIEALLENPTAALTYGRLFRLRSKFVHGRVMEEISGADRTSARSLARSVAEGLVQEAATSNATDRATYLEGLAPSRPPK
jgi:hypothetical protein